MDTKRLISAMAMGLGLILLYYTALPWVDRMLGITPHAPVAATSTSQPAATQYAAAPTSQEAVAGAGTRPADHIATTNPGIAAASGGAQVGPATQPSINLVPASLGSPKFKDRQFTLQLNVLPTGAGIGSVVLNDYKDTDGKKPYVFQTPLPNRLDTEPLGSKSLTVDGVTFDLAGVQWSLTRSTSTDVTYGADLMQNGTKLLALTKTFKVYPRTELNKGFETRVEFGFENATAVPQKIRLSFNGPTLPPPETNRPPDRQVVGGYVVDKDNSMDVEFHPIEEFKPDKNNGEVDLTKSPKGHPARWAGAVSNYFAAVVVPLDMQVNGSPANADYIASIVAHGVNIDKATPIDDHQVYVTFQTTEITLNPGKPVSLPMSVYLGPKLRDLLDSSYYASFPRRFDLLGVIKTSMCGIPFCTFEWLTRPIIGLLGVMHYVFRDWGLAIIGLVAIVRLLLHPITKRSQISMSKMSKMGPEMERLRKKYGDDKEALNKAMVEFHREQGLAPYLGCLPMFLQMPIWIALYGVLQNTFELRQAPFFYGLTWIHDLAQPDFLTKFPHPVQVFFFELRGINLLPVFLSVVMFIQTKLMPKPATASPEQLQQQKMMQWLSPAMFLFFFYNLPSGLNLYIFTSTTVGIIESKIVRDHLKEREEAEKAGRVLVPTKPTRGNRQGGGSGVSEVSAGPRGPMGWLGARWAKLLEHAENVRHDQERRGGGKTK